MEKQLDTKNTKIIADDEEKSNETFSESICKQKAVKNINYKCKIPTKPGVDVVGGKDHISLQKKRI
jgi:hypothetical protein